MTVLSIDIESYSDINLRDCGVYKYVSSPNFAILLFAYAFDDDPVKIIDLTKEELPDNIIKAIKDEEIIKSAFNAQFERVCLSVHLDIYLSPKGWQCSAVHSRYLGLPGSLKKAAEFLKLDQKKDKRGMSLIRYFSIPKKTSNKKQAKFNGINYKRNMPEDDPKKWEEFKEYCKQDVEVERAIRKKLSAFPISESEQRLWEVDQIINGRGVMVDYELALNAIELDENYQHRLMEKMKEITKLKNPNSVSQLKAWLKDKYNIEVKSLAKGIIPDIIKRSGSDEVETVLNLRKEMAKTSIKKYETMTKTLMDDHRIRGLLMFYGASKTGRWAGRLVQVQNLPRNKLKDLDLARRLLKNKEYETFELLFNVPNTLSQLIRTAFIAHEGYKFIVSDFSAIEARVIAWMAGEKWRLDVFNSHGKIYEASASAMFHVPIESIDKGSPLRQKGKIAELALGYGGSVGALKQMGALDMGLDAQELKPLVYSWRNSNPNIVNLWYKCENAAMRAIELKTKVKVKNLIFNFEKGGLFIKLPSGRSLVYPKATIAMDERFDKPCIMYHSDSSKGYGITKTYGGKLVENIIQAIARDCLAVAMMRLEDKGYQIVMHVHDEVVIEAPEKVKVETINEIMGRNIDWAPGLPLEADGYETKYYMKD